MALRPTGPARRWLVLSAALLAAAVTARLGVWQLDRAQQKQQWRQALTERGALPPLTTAALARDEAGAQAQHHRRAMLHGHWLPSATVYLDNRAMGGRAGFIVVTPLQLASGDAVLVQRGWQPRDAADRSRVQPVPTPDGPVQVPGRIAPPPSQLLSLGTDGQGAIRQNLNLPAFAREIGVALRPLSLQQTGAAQLAAPLEAGRAEPAPDGLLRDWPVPAADIGKHHGYAFQWFALCALVIGLYVWFQLIQPRRHAAHRA